MLETMSSSSENRARVTLALALYRTYDVILFPSFSASSKPAVFP